MDSNKHLLISILSLMLFVSGCGGGNTNTNTNTNDIESGISDNNDQSSPENEAITLKFNLSNAKTLITKSKLIQSVPETKQRAMLRATATNAGSAISEQPSVFSYRIADSTVATRDANSDKVGSSNLLAIDKEGNAQLAIDTDGQIKVLYTVASPNGESIYIAIDNSSYWYDDGNVYSPEHFFSERNCALYEVKISDNSFRCVTNGLYVQKIDDNYLKTISGNQKPIQFDADNNMYFSATNFEVIINGNPCTDFEINESTGEQRCLIEASETSDIWIDSSDWSPRIYKQDATTKEVTALTQDNNFIDFFSVLSSGEVITQYVDTSSYESTLSLIQGNQIIDLNTNNWGVDFFTVDNGNTVIFGSNDYHSNSSDNGIKLARPRAQGGTDLASLDTSLFSSTADDSWRNTKPYRVILDNNGRIYGVFEGDVKRQDKKGNEIWQNTLTVYQVLPYNAVPRLEIVLPKHYDWWRFMDNTPFQISNGFLYYKNSVEVDGYGTADVINIHNLETRETKQILKATNELRYEIYNWKLVDNILYFSALNKAKNEVVTGEIDTTKITEGDNSEAISINTSLSAIGAVSAVSDIEVIPSKTTEPNSEESPKITKVHQDSENLYSMSIDFNHYINHETIDTGLKLNSSRSEGPDGDRLIPTLKVWVNKTLHLIPDLDGLGNSETIPMTPGETYTLDLDKGSIKDKYGRALALDEKSFAIKMRPEDGFYIGSIKESNKTTPNTIASGRILKYSGNEKNIIETFDLGEVPHNVRLEFSAKNGHWNSIGILYFDDTNTNQDVVEKTLATIDSGSFINVNYLAMSGYTDWEMSDSYEFFNGNWKRYRLDFYGNNIKIYISKDGVNFIEKSEVSVDNFVTRKDDKHHLYLHVANLMSFDNIEIIELDSLGKVKDGVSKILNDKFDNYDILPDKYNNDITKDKRLGP